MARFDVYRDPSGIFLLDCQADVLSDLNTRFVVPLLSQDHAPVAGYRLNPSFQIEGAPFVLYPQFAASVPVRDLSKAVASLGGEADRIVSALDMLISGF